MTATIDLTPEQRDTVLQLLARHLPNTEAWAYGSRAKWTSRPQSDLDLVVFAKPQQARAVSDLREAYEESNLPFRVDLFVWDEVPEAFREQIEREYVVLVKPQTCVKHWSKRRLDECIVMNEATYSPKEKWRKVSIDDIADIAGGGTPSTKNAKNFDGDIPWLTPKDLSGTHERYVERGSRNLSQRGLDGSSAKLVPAGTVLLSTRAPIGYVALAKNPITTNQGFRALMGRDGVFPEYLYYWLKLNTEELERHASGSTFKELSGSSLKKIELPLPPLPEQRAIAHILGTLDDKIELNRRMNRTLEAMARALFKSWFVDFDPVRAKMALKQHAVQRSHSPLEGESAGQGRSPQSLRWGDAEAVGPGAPHPPTESAFACGSTSSTPPQGGSDWTAERARAYLDNMDQEIIALFPDRLVDSKLGEIPEGWRAGVLNDAVKLLNGGTPRTSVAGFWNGDIPWYTAKDAPHPHDVFVVETERTITQAGVDNSATTVLPPQTTIISARGTVGRLACLGRSMAMNQTCYGIQGAGNYQDFFTYWLVRMAVEELRSRTHGTIFDTITRQTFTLVDLPLPPVRVAEAFESVATPIMKRILNNIHESGSTATLRDALLPRLISGQLRVDDRELPAGNEEA